jgi:hypothetical protein
MAVTIKNVEDAIIAALAADETIAAWGGFIGSADSVRELGERARANYPIIGVVFSETDDPGGAMAGGSGGGVMFARSATFSINLVDKNYRGKDAGRSGDAYASRNPGVYAMTEAAIRVLGYKNFGLAIKRLEYAGDVTLDMTGDQYSSGRIVNFRTQWETTCTAD